MTMWKWRAAGLMMVMCLISLSQMAFGAEDAGAFPDRDSRETVFMVSPLFGWDRNELNMHGPGGQMSALTDTAPQYGLFFLLAHRNFVLTDFLFYTDVNSTDVSGNLVFANYYGDRKARLSWNVGAGHLYHKIEPVNEDISVNVPMVKAGPLINIPEWHVTVNPYAGYAWERIRTQHGNQDNDSYLYGITLGWRWRMLAASVKYYYQDSQEADDDYQTVRARAHCMFDEHWGAVVRVDYMEHSTSDDTSVLAGPVYVF